MLGQVVTAHEAAIADGADKFLLASVCSAVSGKFVRPGKLFVTTVPVTAEWFFTCAIINQSIK